MGARGAIVLVAAIRKTAMVTPIFSAAARPLVHIGFHKTASTLLQRLLFARRDLGFERPLDDRVRIQGDFVNVGPFDVMPELTARAYQRSAQEAASHGRTLVISHERLSGYPGSGAFDAPLIAERIKNCLPDARILIFVREQCDLIGSYYLQYITDGGSMSFGRFTSPLQPRMYRRPQFNLDTFAFVKTIAYYRRLFGSENVLVVPYEALREEPWHVAQAIAEHAGQDPTRIPADIFEARANAAMPILMQMLRRRLNGMVNRNQLSPHAPIRFGPWDRWFSRARGMFEFTRAIDGPFRARLERQVSDLVGDNFAQTNRELQRLTPYDLQRFSYRMASAPAVRGPVPLPGDTKQRMKAPS